MKTKTIDCVEMKRKGAAIVQKKTAGMTLRQELDFWRGQTNDLRKRQARIRKKTARK